MLGGDARIQPSSHGLQMAPRRTGCMRWLWSLAIWCLLTTTAIATVGFAADGPLDEAPAHMQTAPSRPGDRALYKAALVVVQGDDGHWTDLNARVAVERLDDRWMFDAAGDMVAVRSWMSEWASEPYQFDLGAALDLDLPSCLDELSGGVGPSGFDPSTGTWSGGRPGAYDPDAIQEQWGGRWDEYGEAWEACGKQMEAWGEDLQERVDVWSRREHQVPSGGWRVTHHGDTDVATTHGSDNWPPLAAVLPGLPTDTTWTVPTGSAGPCGWHHDALEGRVPIEGRLSLRGACPPAIDLGFATTQPVIDPVLRASGVDRVGDRQAVVYALPEDPEALRVWLAQDVPLPVRMLQQIDVVPPDWVETRDKGPTPRFYILLELVEHAFGDDAARMGDAPPLGPVAGRRTMWGPSDMGVGHAWPFSTAFLSARGAPDSALDAWLRDHPDAAVDSVRFTAPARWTFTMVDGDDGLRGDIILEGSVNVTATPFTARDRPDDTEQPDAVPSIGSLARRHAALTGHDGVSGWSYVAGCTPGCAQVGVRTVLGQRPDWGDDALDVVLWDGQGRPEARAQRDAYPEPTFSDPSWSPSGDDAWHWSVASTGVWVWPEPIATGSIVAFTGLASLLYLLWPVLKGAGAMPMFSRIRHEDLLEHPVRGELMQRVQASPGVHFQQLVRDTGKGRGTMEHHLRKLIQAGLVVERPGRGFTCYFPKGAVDRRLMQAASSLKSAGARDVLRAVHASPGAVSADVVARLGMAPSTVNYHLKRLVDAGLVDTTREGRVLRLHATDLGGEALGTFRT